MHKDAANDSASASLARRFFFFFTQDAPRSRPIPAAVALLEL